MRKKLQAVLTRLVRDENGQDLIEYALLAGFISLVAILAITTMGTGINKVFTDLSNQISGIGK